LEILQGNVYGGLPSIAEKLWGVEFAATVMAKFSSHIRRASLSSLPM